MRLARTLTAIACAAPIAAAVSWTSVANAHGDHGDHETKKAKKRKQWRRIMNEAETRAEHIDPALKAAGWGVVEGSRIHREYSITPGRTSLGHSVFRRGDGVPATAVAPQ